jgi:hypothetical protein
MLPSMRRQRTEDSKAGKEEKRGMKKESIPTPAGRVSRGGEEEGAQ